MKRLGRQSRFGDVELRGRVLPRAKKIVFFAPHTREQPATMPLISEISERLKKDGIESETHAVDDMDEKVISLSTKLRGLDIPDEDRAAFSVFFYLHDAYVRLRIVRKLLERSPDANIVEMHALDKDYKDDSIFPWENYFYRIPGTRILYSKEATVDYENSITNAFLVDEQSRLCIRILAAEIGLDLASVGEHTEDLLERLEENSERFMLVEIPAPAHCMCEGVDVHTMFERKYAYSFSQPHTLKQHDIEALYATICGRSG